jgi:dTDP-4-amino-4,6-dideoxygalactose transaminase
VTVPFLELARGIRAQRAELDAAIAGALDEARFVGGSAVAEFERAWAAYCGADHAVGVASGTDALELALRAAGIGPGDEVVTAANTCAPTVAAIESAGGTPVLADADPRTRTLDPESVARAIGPRTRAIVPVHLYGRCADMTAIVGIAREHGLVVVEDAAQAHGAEHRGRRCGSLADAAAFSFYPTKNLGALGDAGAVVTSDRELAERVRMLRSYGESERYRSVVPGRNSRLDTVQAAVLLARLARLDAANERRRELAALYRQELADLPLELPEEPPDGLHVFHLYVVRVAERERVRAELGRAGVDTLVHYGRAVHEHPAYAALRRELPVSEALAREVVSLPLYPELRDGEAAAVVEAARAVLTALRRAG